MVAIERKPIEQKNAKIEQNRVENQLNTQFLFSDKAASVSEEQDVNKIERK